MIQQHDTAPSSAPWTVTGRPNRTNPVTVALTAGATSNLLALATLGTVLLDAPTWLVITCTASAALAASAARYAIRMVPAEPHSHNNFRQ